MVKRSLIVLLLLFSRTTAGFHVLSRRKEAWNPLLVSTENLGTDNVLEEYEDYSSSLSPKEERADVLSEGFEFRDQKSSWVKPFLFPFRSAGKVLRRRKPGALILMHCGESESNVNNTFTGWSDPELTPQGIKECEHAGRLLLAEGYHPDVVYTSRLKRCIKSAIILLEEIDSLYTPIRKTYRLNQRSYGTLQGLSKVQTAKEFGTEVVQAWRNSLKARPPPMKRSDPEWPGNDRRYADIPLNRIPLTESLLDCHRRAAPLWEHKIRRDLAKGKNVLVVAHRDSLRGIIRAVEHLRSEEVLNVATPTGMPFVYRFDRQMTPIKPLGKLRQAFTSAKFLEKPGLLKKALKRQKQWTSDVPGLVSGEDRVKRVSTMEESLIKLKQEQNLASVRPPVPRTSHSEASFANELWADDPTEFEDCEFFYSGLTKEIPVTVEPLSKKQGDLPVDRKGPFVVLIRHGRTPHNNLGLFTGWEDPSLADDGVEDAKNAGRILKMHGIQFDVCYTSWLTRAIQTAYHVLDELDTIWVPCVKSWRLNERMYGALTGKSKSMIANEYGEEQLKRWRRGYKIKPPPASSYSLSYPGNDVQRTKGVKDLRISFSETFTRSLEQRKLVLHRKFPKTESLKDCMDRSIPFYTKRIQEEAVNNGKRVLITSHENALRGILMHLCGIPEEAMNQLHLPNGLPLVYNVKGKCISLLDDGTGKDPMKQHDFGPAAKYLFKPCEITDDFYEEMESKVAS